MVNHKLVRAAALVITAFALAACGPRETPELRLQALRMNHDIVPVGTTTLHSASGEPTLLVDLRVTNHGVIALDKLTVLVKVQGQNGSEKLLQRTTLNLEGTRPGIGVQVTATAPGFQLEEGDEVTVELESNLPPETLHELPEWQAVASQ